MIVLLALTLAVPAPVPFDATRVVKGSLEQAIAPAVADIDGDGLNDVVFVDTQRNSLQWIPGADLASSDPSEALSRYLADLSAVS